MSRGDRAFIAALLLLAALGFLPWARTARWGDMVALGWLMAALMVFSPLVALARLWWRPTNGPQASTTEPPTTTGPPAGGTP